MHLERGAIGTGDFVAYHVAVDAWAMALEQEDGEGIAVLRQLPALNPPVVDGAGAPIFRAAIGFANQGINRLLERLIPRGCKLGVCLATSIDGCPPHAGRPSCIAYAWRGRKREKELFSPIARLFRCSVCSVSVPP
jgi:hypothetical protein